MKKSKSILIWSCLSLVMNPEWQSKHYCMNKEIATQMHILLINKTLANLNT